VTLVKMELSKIVRYPAVICFIAACLAANVFLVIVTNHKAEIDYLNEVAQVTGTEYGEEYTARLQTVPAPRDDFEKMQLYEQLLLDAVSAKNIFAEMEDIPYSVRTSSALPGITKEILGWKYGMLMPVIAEKAANDDGASVFFGSMTNGITGDVFGVTGRVLAGECCLFFTLITLFAICYEDMAGKGAGGVRGEKGQEDRPVQVGGGADCRNGILCVFLCRDVRADLSRQRLFRRVGPECLGAVPHELRDIHLHTVPIYHLAQHDGR